MKRPTGFDRSRSPAEGKRGAEIGAQRRPVERAPSATEPVGEPVEEPTIPTASPSAGPSRSNAWPDAETFATVGEQESGPPIALEATAAAALPETEPGDVRAAQRRLRQAERAVRGRQRGERRRFTAHLRRRRRLWLIAGGAVLSLAAFVAVGVFTPLMAVKEVRVEGASQVNAAELLAAMEPFQGVPLALIDEGEVHRALEPFSVIERYAIERVPPQTLVLRVEERQAAIALASANGFDLYDPAGVRLGSSDERPVGVPVGEAATADPTTAAFRAAARIVRDLPDEVRVNIESVSATSDLDITFTVTGGTQVIWGDAERTQQKATVLSAMIAAVGLPAVIDVSSPEAPVFR